MLSSTSYYGEYHGHTIPDLETVHAALREDGKPICFLAGDSSLDNKHWFHDTARAEGPFSKILDPSRSTQDIEYWLTRESKRRGAGYNCLNSAVEESTVGNRTHGAGGNGTGKLLPQDVFIQQNIREEDVLIVSGTPTPKYLSTHLTSLTVSTCQSVATTLHCAPITSPSATWRF